MERLGVVAMAVFLACLSGNSPGCAGHPAYVPVDPAVALVQSDPGRTTFLFSTDLSGWTATLSRSVTDACDVVAILGGRSLFDLRARVRLLPSLFPLRIEVEAGWNRLEALGALHLGPIRLVADRSWGAERATCLALHASRPGLSVALGVLAGGDVGPFITASWLPDPVRLWSLTLRLSSHGTHLAVGGTW